MSPARRARTVAAVRALHGLLLLTRPRAVLVHVHRLPATPVETTVLRVLGARQLAQALVTWVRPVPGVVRAGAVTDVAHGASMVALAVLDPARRRAGLVESAVAVGFAAAAG